MNLSAFLDPTVVTISIIMAAYLLFQLWVDRARLRQHPRVKLRHVTGEMEKKSISVLVTLTRRAETVTGLLDHLDGHGYTRLEVLVVVKQTAGTNAAKLLERYRKQRPNFKLRIITHKKGLTPRIIASRYAAGQLILELDPAERLSPGFFGRVSSHFNVASLHQVVPSTFVTANSSVSSGLASWASVFSGLRSLLAGALPVSSAVVWQREAYLSGSAVTARPDSSVFVLKHIGQLGSKPGKGSRKPAYTWIAAITILTTSLGLAALGQAPVSVVLIALATMICYGLVTLLLVSSVRGATVMQRLNLLLLTPLTPLLALYVLVKRPDTI
ncbi:MAG TPA: hypothetical protein PK096_02205 [Candidatus Saccharibacteria bacterium]|nr:hypothetical protein [Candidatus Saccharibacteria bacterium]HRK94158.1 hypothetical protein [Candidatus Saccharibacteria bacterium]